MDNLLDLLNAVKGVVGHGNVTWSWDNDGQIILYTGLTDRDRDGRIMSTDRGLALRPTEATEAFTEMGNG